MPQGGLEQLLCPSVYDNRQMGWPGLGRGREGPAVFRALASPRKPPPNNTQTPRAGQMQSAQLCQPVPGSPCNWSQAFPLAFGIGQRRGEEPSAVGSQALAWPGSPSSEQRTGRGTKARHSFLWGRCPSGDRCWHQAELKKECEGWSRTGRDFIRPRKTVMGEGRVF